MSDKVGLISGLVSFWTGSGGCLVVKNGAVIHDKVKCFNRARRYRNAGVNMFREMRRGTVEWGAVKAFDWQSPGYWTLLREHFDTKSNPFQGANPPPRAGIIFELFDECGGDAAIYYNNPALARQLIRAAFANLGDLPYVKFGVGNEMNSPAAVAFMRDIVFPEFEEVGWVPYSYGAAIGDMSGGETGPAGQMELQKNEAVKIFGNIPAHCIARQVHGLVDQNSPNLIATVRDWMIPGSDYPPIIFSDDGAVTGASACNVRPIPSWWGDAQRGPAVEQTKAMMKYVFDRATNFTLPNGQVKYGFEHLALQGTTDICTAQTYAAMSQMYAAKFGVWPESYGKFPKDWVEPGPPPPPVQQFTLTVKLGEGTGGMPARTAKYDKGNVVNYSYAAKANYGLLKVKLDNVRVKVRGTVVMNKNHALTTSATPRMSRG